MGTTRRVAGPLILAAAVAALAAGVWTYAARPEPVSPKHVARSSPEPASRTFAPADGDVYIGVSTDLDRLDAFDEAAGIGAHPAIYDQWTRPDGAVQPTLTSARTKAGMTPMVSWNLPLTGGVVTDGSQDSYIRAQADAIRAFAAPVFVRLDWEMNAAADWYPDWNEPGVSPAQFIASWQHVYQVFRQEGVTNAAFVWCTTLGNGPGGASPGTWYPGDAYVDWIGVDAYPQSKPATAILGGPGGLDDQEAFAEQHGKPLMVAEWAPSLPHPDTAAPVDLILDFAKDHPSTVKALVYFDFAKDGKDYTLVDHPVGAAEFRTRVDGQPQYLMTVR